MEEAAPVPEKKTSTGKIVAFVGCGCLGLIALMIAGVAILFFGIMGVIKKSDAYSDTLALVQSHPEAIAALGEPIEPGFMLMGNISIENGEGAADLTIPVSGPRGSGTMRVVADKSSGSSSWNYTTRELRLDGGDAAVIQLTP